MKWPMVALAAILAGAVVGIFALIPADEPGSRTMLLTAMTASSSAIVMWFVNRKTTEIHRKVEDVEKIVNGNTQRLIDKIPDPRVRATEQRRQDGRMDGQGTQV